MAGALTSLRVVSGLSARALCELQAEGSLTVAELKARIAKELGIPVEEQRLLFQQRVLADKSCLGEALGAADAAEVLLLRVDPSWAKALAELRTGALLLRSASDELRADREAVLAALDFDSHALEHAAEVVRADPEVVQAHSRGICVMADMLVGSSSPQSLPVASFGTRLAGRNWRTLDLEAPLASTEPQPLARDRNWRTLDLEAPSASTEPQRPTRSGPVVLHSRSASRFTAIALPEPRATATRLLTRSFTGAGAEPEVASEWAGALEAAAWQSFAQRDNAAIDDAFHVGYRAEVRRLSLALKEPSVGGPLLKRMRDGDLTPRALMLLPRESLLPEAKRARLESLSSRTPKESGKVDLPFFDERMACVECGKVGSVRYCHLQCVREGFTKAETWGNKDNDDRGQRCKAQCDACLAEWTFEL